MARVDQDVELTEEQKAERQAEQDRRYALDNQRNRGLERIALLVEGIGSTTDSKEQAALASLLHREYNKVSDLADQLGDRSQYYANQVRLFYS